MIFHIDMSNNYRQGCYSVIALVSVDSDNKLNRSIQKGIVVVDPVRKEILEKFQDVYLHASVISKLIRGLDPIKKIIVCPDINPVEKVGSFIQHIRPDMFGRIKSLTELREEIGEPTLRSAADAFAGNINRNFPKRSNYFRRKPYFEDGSVIIISDKNSADYKELLNFINKIQEKENKEGNGF